MSDFLRTALALLLTVAPLGAVGPFGTLTEPTARLQRTLVSALAALALLSGTALLADPFLDWIDVSPENFQLAAALIVLPHAFHLIISGNSMRTRNQEGNSFPVWLLPLTVPLLAGPASVAATMSYASRFGSGTAIAAAALVLALSVAVLANPALFTGVRGSHAISIFNRFSGALLIALAVELAVDGIRSV